MKLKTKLYLILFAILLFNLFQLFINLESEFDDFETYSEAGNALLSGQNPYVLEIAEKQYPPGHFYIYAAIIFLFGQNKLAFKLVVLAVHYTLGYCIFLLVRKIVEINQDFKKKHPHINQQTVTRLHKKNRITIPPLVARDLKNKELIPWTAMFLFLIFPPELMRAFSGLNDPFPTLCYCLFLIYFIKKKTNLAAIFFAFAFLIKLTTLFLYPIMIIYYFKSGRLKDMYKFILISISIIILGFLPFLIDNFIATIKGLGFLFHEKITVANHLELWEDYELIHESLFTIWILEFSLWFVFQVCLYSSVIAYLVFKIKSNNQDILFLSMMLVYFFIPIFTHSFGIRYYAWASPLVCSHIAIKRKYYLYGVFLSFTLYSIFYYGFEFYIVALIWGLSLNIFLIVYTIKRIDKA